MKIKYNVEDYIGKKFNRWTILEGIDRKEKINNCVTAICDCGTKRETVLRNIVLGYSKSCGCYGREVSSATYKKINQQAGKNIHDLSATHVYNCWAAMRSRCSDTTNNRYYLYGAKGIEVCEEWDLSFNIFLQDMGMPPTKFHSIDRKDPTKNYDKTNCRWATPKEQSNNRTSCLFITHKGKTQSMMSWAKELNVEYRRFYYFIKQGLNITQAAAKATGPYKEKTRSKNLEYHQFKAACTSKLDTQDSALLPSSST